MICDGHQPCFSFRIPLRAIIGASCHESEITSQCYSFEHAKYHEIVASLSFRGSYLRFEFSEVERGTEYIYQ